MARVIGVLACLALVADLALERLSNAQLPVLGGTRAATRLALAITAAAAVAVKFLLNVHFDYFGLRILGGRRAVRGARRGGPAPGNLNVA